MLDFKGVTLVEGQAEGAILHADVPISFWGGIDPATGAVIDRSHPLFGETVAGRILAIPAGRGSCTGSSVMMELISNGHAPAGLVVSRREEILTLGVIVAEELFGRSIPVLELDPADFARLASGGRAAMAGNRLTTGEAHREPVSQDSPVDVPDPAVALTERDRAMLDGAVSEAARLAMKVVLRMAALQGAPDLIDVTRAHIDGCIYTGPASLRFAETLRDMGGRVCVPTTLNAISVDQRRWREQGTDPALALPASDLADAYVAMGARPSFTCAPYLLEGAPLAGEDIAWAESNAVVYANSVLGARTMKYPDYLDLCIALTGRAPRAGCHVAENRQATQIVAVDLPDAGADDSLYPLLGYAAGLAAPAGIPLITGLERLSPSPDDLKAFSAAFGTTSGAPMFHMAGQTPEAAGCIDPARHLPRVTVGPAALQAAFRMLNSAPGEAVDLVALGNPHFSLEEFRRLATLARGRTVHPAVALVVTTGRATLDRAEREGLAAELADFGARLVTDACWCTVSEPVVPPAARTILTNSAKYAHYGPGLTGRLLRFASLADCVEAAVTGRLVHRVPDWIVNG